MPSLTPEPLNQNDAGEGRFLKLHRQPSEGAGRVENLWLRRNQEGIKGGVGERGEVREGEGGEGEAKRKCPLK